MTTKHDQLQLYLTTGALTNYPTSLNGRYKLTLHEIQYVDAVLTPAVIEVQSNTIFSTYSNQDVNRKGILFTTAIKAAANSLSLVNLDRVFYVDIKGNIDLYVYNITSGATAVFSALILNFTIEKVYDL